MEMDPCTNEAVCLNVIGRHTCDSLQDYSVLNSELEIEEEIGLDMYNKHNKYNILRKIANIASIFFFFSDF